MLPQHAVLLPNRGLASDITLSSLDCKLPGGSDHIAFDLQSPGPGMLLETEQVLQRRDMNFIKSQFLLELIQQGFHESLMKPGKCSFH